RSRLCRHTADNRRRDAGVARAAWQRRLHRELPPSSGRARRRLREADTGVATARHFPHGVRRQYVARTSRFAEAGRPVLPRRCATNGTGGWQSMTDADDVRTFRAPIDAKTFWRALG